ncbi:MAG TPA: rhodanese-like domain-containing protein [Microthrixaceae bacterium]|nr:rhodanese-like domain-containing protein [Microthrixaceae bacterium]
MIFEQYELSCLSQFSYLIGDETTGRAVVVDPQRDVSQYLADAAAHGLTIERVIETHFHADFLSGHLELADATGATISFGPGAEAEFPIDNLSDGQILDLGEVRLEVRHTPGHTPESISIVVWAHPGDKAPWAVLTGDALFIGDVGRPDLLTSIGWTAEDLARKLFHSLHDQLLTLPDDTIVFPSHGAGSACGKNLSTANRSTIGEQRRTNPALSPMTEDAFVEAVTSGHPVAPPYFVFAATTNRRDRDLLDEDAATPRLSVEEALRLVEDGAVMIDGRDPETFAVGHLVGAVNVGLDGRFAEYAGGVARPDQPVIVITEPGREDEARIRLARIGFDRVVGAVADVDAVLASHLGLVGVADRLSPDEAARTLADESGRVQLVDVRNPGETVGGALPGAVNVPLASLLDRIDDLDPTIPTVVYCAGGYRSSVAASLLRSRGFTDVADILGGYDAVAASAAV